MLRQEMEPLPDHRFHIHGTARRLPGGPFLLRCAGSPQRARRTRHLLSDGDDSLFFQWTKSTRYAEHLGREIELGPGDAILFSCSETRTITLPSRFEAITIKVPRKALGPLLREADSCFARAIDRARRMLMSRRFDHERIIDVALACGFGDISYFNRTFLARYGAAPSDIRAVRLDADDAAASTGAIAIPVLRNHRSGW